jgi:hypothetical protein
MAAIEPPTKHRRAKSGWIVATSPGNRAMPMMPTPKTPSATRNRRRSTTCLSRYAAVKTKAPDTAIVVTKINPLG